MTKKFCNWLKILYAWWSRIPSVPNVISLPNGRKAKVDEKGNFVGWTTDTKS